MITMDISTISLIELFDSFVSDGVIEKPRLFGLTDFSPASFDAAGYELVGDSSDFHFYEKAHVARYRGRAVDIIFKSYFLSGREIGNGIGVGPGVRLISLLRHYKAMRGLAHISDGGVKFYFSNDRRDGAVIFDDSLVVRFVKKTRHGGYLVRTIESDFDRTGNFKRIATGSVKSSMDFCNLFEAKGEFFGRGKCSAFDRLAKFYLT
ncbi:hypothetical protein DM39_5902 [Burkholderia cenocepacia]|uniref:Uncharacterized protein n=1 Tax=Burkholderia cenocepacia TaxID=95486 RepID=A0AAN0RYU8_9BURK|nr:hypothetical protein DM39_5902 [Burkholderia cenocepacia]